MNVEDMRQIAHAHSDKLSNLEQDVNAWLEKLVSNCADDPSNSQAYIINATMEVNEYIARSSAVQACFEVMINPMKNNKKLRKMGELTQTVFPMLIMAKLLQLIDQKLGA